MGLQKEFNNFPGLKAYVPTIPALLQSKGFIAASVDSVLYDSVSAKVWLFIGELYKWAHINTASIEGEVLRNVRMPSFAEKGIDFSTLNNWQKRMLDYLEERGYPFAKTYLDSINIHNDTVSALLKLEKGPLYKIDSIKIYGEVKIDNLFLQRYLDLPNGSVYNKRKLTDIQKRLSTLSYVEEERPYSLTLLSTGSILNIYLKPKKNKSGNQVTPAFSKL